jgi:hypothetical protein
MDALLSGTGFSVESSTDLFGFKIIQDYCGGCGSKGEVKESRGDRVAKIIVMAGLCG